MLNLTSPTLHKADLFAALGRSGDENKLCWTVKGLRQFGSLVSIEREDGSGNCFNVKVRTPAGQTSVVFVRCQD